MSNRKGKGRQCNRSELAEVFGVSMPTVDHWVRSGCPYVEKGGPGKPWRFLSSEVAAWREQRAREEASGTALADEDELRRRKLAAETAKAELDLAQARGKVCDLEQVERALTVAFAAVKANMRNIPGRVVTTLLGETNDVKFKSVLALEIDQALEGLADEHLVGEEDLVMDEADAE